MSGATTAKALFGWIIGGSCLIALAACQGADPSGDDGSCDPSYDNVAYFHYTAQGTGLHRVEVTNATATAADMRLAVFTGYCE